MVEEKECLNSILRDVTKGKMYKSIIMDRSIDGEDLMEVICSQTLFSRGLIETIKKRLQDLVTLSTLKMLSSMNMFTESKDILAQKTMGCNELKHLEIIMVFKNHRWESVFSYN